MFKQHIRKWKLDKKLKRREMVFAIRKVQQRKAKGKETRIVIRNEQLTEAKLHYYFKRRPLSTAEEEELEQSPTTPSDLDYATPRSDDQEMEAECNMNEEPLPTILPRRPSPPISTTENCNQLVKRRPVSPLSSLFYDSPQVVVEASSFIENTIHPQSWSVYYDLNPQESFLRQLYEHVGLATGGQIAKLERKTKFDTTSILRASGWFDEHLTDAIEAERSGRQNQAQIIIKRCANIVAAEVEGYFPDMCVLEMVEIVHFLQVRHAQQLQLDFMFNLYDGVCARLGQFHPLVELLCSATRGYDSSLSASLIPTMLDYLDAHSGNGVSLNLLLPLFAFQQLRLIDAMPREILMHAFSPSDKTCDYCTRAIDQSAFVSQPFRAWAARQFINLLNDIWVEPHTDQSAVWHSTWRSRVWRYIYKYPHMSNRREQLEKMPFKQRFWAVAKICFELVTRNIEKVFLERNNFFPPVEHVSNLIQQSSRKTGLEEEEIWPLCMETKETSLLDSEIHGPDQCREDLCKEARLSVRYWVGEDLCCCP